MRQRRKSARVNVNIPITCTFIDNRYRSILSLGTVYDLSVGGMKISVPLQPYCLKSEIVDYFLVLPNPFIRLQGYGKIKWDEWDHKNNQMILGLEFISLKENQKAEIENIVNELSDTHPQPPFDSARKN